MTAPPREMATIAAPGANEAVFVRAIGSGWVSSIAFRVTTQAGNVGVGVWRNRGRGRNAVPAYCVDAASVSCPAASADGTSIALSAPVFMYPGDWFGFWTDSASLRVRGVTTGISTLTTASYTVPAGTTALYADVLIVGAWSVTQPKFSNLLTVSNTSFGTFPNSGFAPSQQSAGSQTDLPANGNGIPSFTSAENRLYFCGIS